MSTVAQTILTQLGGRRFISMTGAKFLAGHKDALSFRLPQTTKNKSNYIKITLNESDLYDVQFLKIGKRTTQISNFTDIYADSLIELFENETAIYTTL